MQNLKVAILGCGIGGMTAALCLKRVGFHPVIFDQFDKAGPIGSGLLIQPSGQAILAELDLLTGLKEIAAPVHRLMGLTHDKQRRALDMEYRHLGRDFCAYGVHRGSLFSLLYNAVAAQSIELHGNCRVIAVEEHAGGLLPVFSDKKWMEPFDLVLDCCGANSPLSSAKGRILPFGAYWTSVDRPTNNNLATDALEQRYIGASKMAGIMPIGIDPNSGNEAVAIFWSVRLSDIDEMTPATLDQLRTDFLNIWPYAAPMIEQITSPNDLTLARYRHRTGKASAQRRLFHIGDSWHATSPQLGQGANMAMLDADAFARAASMAASIQDIAPAYRHFRSDHIAIYQALSAVFTPMYQSDSATLPAIRDFLIHNFGRLPGVRSLIARIVSGSFYSSSI